MRKQAMDALLEMEVPACNKGFHYIADVMEIYATDESYMTGKMTVLQEQIAKRYGCSSTSVERTIRYAFNIALTHGNPEVLKKYLGTYRSRPTSRKLLAHLYLKLKEQRKDEQ